MGKRKPELLSLTDEEKAIFKEVENYVPQEGEILDELEFEESTESTDPPGDPSGKAEPSSPSVKAEALTPSNEEDEKTKAFFSTITKD
jgi:DNA replication initiation complex subunit (GINS family)